MPPAATTIKYHIQQQETAMPLKLMYITNRPDVAAIAERNGVDRIFVDMEYIGKAERQ